MKEYIKFFLPRRIYSPLLLTSFSFFPEHNEDKTYRGKKKEAVISSWSEQHTTQELFLLFGNKQVGRQFKTSQFK